MPSPNPIEATFALTTNKHNEAVELQDLLVRPSIDSTTASSALEHLISDDESQASSTSTSSRTLPPVDGGRGAWTFLLGCWLVEACIWGFPLSFGVFHSYYSSHELFRTSPHIATIGTLATGVSFLGMPLTNALVLRWPHRRRIMCVTGWFLCVLGLIGASCATRTWHLLLFQGLLYGVGWVVCYTPFLFMLNEWFVEKRGLAYGVLFGASGVSGLLIPVMVGWLLERYGFRVALRVYAAVTVVLSGPALSLIRPRAPVRPNSLTGGLVKEAKGISWNLLMRFSGDIHFWLFAAAVFIQGLGFFIPNIYIPSFAQDLGLSSSSSAGLLALVSFAQVLGQLWQGWISDRVHIYFPVALSALIPGLGALLLWGPAKDTTRLIPFAIIWGFFSASYSVLYTRMCTFLTTSEGGMTDESLSMLLYGFFSFERGMANVLEGPICSLLIGDAAEVDREAYGLRRYAAVVWFTVVCMLVCSASGLGWFHRHQKPRSGMT